MEELTTEEETRAPFVIQESGGLELERSSHVEQIHILRAGVGWAKRKELAESKNIRGDVPILFLARESHCEPDRRNPPILLIAHARRIVSKGRSGRQHAEGVEHDRNAVNCSRHLISLWPVVHYDQVTPDEQVIIDSPIIRANSWVVTRQEESGIIDYF